VIDLDDPRALRAGDPSDMLGRVAALATHCRDAYAAGRATDQLPDLTGVSAVVFCGMGGSAVAGDVLRTAFRDRLRVPVDVNRSPALPGYAGARTLVIVSSFSGNTSETLSAFRQAVDRGCRIVAVTSGGTLAKECDIHGVPVVAVPAGYQPRAALGHLTFAGLGSLESAGLLPTIEDDVAETVDVLEAVARELAPRVPALDNRAKRLAVWIGDRVPVIWGAEGIGAVAAMRWKTQMNENGKVPAFHASMSELDHNEVVGWVEPYGARYAVIGVRHDGEDREIAARFALSADIARDAGALYDEVGAEGSSTLARLFSLVLTGDVTSCFVGIRRGIDPTPVTAIDRLKGALASR
jgi:glucose/mannose-6-phosphate isomerase